MLPSAAVRERGDELRRAHAPRDGVRRFALIGVDLVQASPERHRARQRRRRRADGRRRHRPGRRRAIAGARAGLDQHPHRRLRGRRPTAATPTPPVTTAADVLDLRPARPRPPARGRRRPERPPASSRSESPTAGHKWNFDDAGFGTHTGFERRLDVGHHPARAAPKLVTTTGLAGQGDRPEVPRLERLHPAQLLPAQRRARSSADAAPSFANGNVLLVTEEDYEQTDCTPAGSFQTWWVKRLDGTRTAIVPLDKVELADLGTLPAAGRRVLLLALVRLPRRGHRRGRLLRRRHPADRRTQPARPASPFGHAVWPGLGGLGRHVGAGLRRPRPPDRREEQPRSTPIDLVRGIDVYAVDVPGDGRGAVPSDVGRAPSFAHRHGHRQRAAGGPGRRRARRSRSPYAASRRAPITRTRPGRSSDWRVRPLVSRLVETVAPSAVGDQLPLAARLVVGHQPRRRHRARRRPAAGRVDDRRPVPGRAGGAAPVAAAARLRAVRRRARRPAGPQGRSWSPST